MKKLALITITAIYVVYAVLATFYENPIIAKVIVGTARVLFPPINATVKIDDNTRDGVTCFAERTTFDGEPSTT
jgi:hypothetical protein